MNIAFLILLLSVANKQVRADTQASTCSASVTLSPKSSWNQNAEYYQMYDLLVQNTGSCTITSLFVNVAHPAGTNIVSPSYNFDTATGEITNFGGALAPGQSFNSAGFTLSASSASLSQSALTVSVSQQSCSSCPTSGPAEPTTVTSIDPTIAPSIAPSKAPTFPPTKGPSKAPTYAATKAPTPRAASPTLSPTSSPTRGPTVSATAVPTIRPAANCYNRCTQDEICADLNQYYGDQCYPRNCQAITCGSGEICIGDGGVARCIVTNSSAVQATNAPTPFPSDDLCNGMCTKGEVCVTLNQTEGYQCQLQSCAGASCNAGYTCIDDGGVARCIHTGSKRSEKPMKQSASSPDVLSVLPSSISVPVSGCAVSVSAVPRARSAHVEENGLMAQIWDLVITNENAETPNQIEIDVSVASGNFVSQTWNLIRIGGQSSSRYSVTTHGIFSHNNKFFAAGLVVSGSGAIPSVSVSSVTCRAL